MRDAYVKLLTPIRRLPNGVRLVGSLVGSVVSLARLFVEKLKTQPVIVSISPELNNNGLALPLSNRVVLGERYTPDAPKDVLDVSVGWILAHEIGHIHDYRGIERGFIHRFFLLFPFIVYEYLKNVIKDGTWTNISFRAIMWTINYGLYQFVASILLPALVPKLVELGIPVEMRVQTFILTTMIWLTYTLGVKLRSEVFANMIAYNLFLKIFQKRQGALLMREEKYYLTEIIILNVVLGLAFIFPQIALIFVDFFTSIFTFYMVIATASTFAPLIALRATQKYGQY